MPGIEVQILDCPFSIVKKQRHEVKGRPYPLGGVLSEQSVEAGYCGGWHRDARATSSSKSVSEVYKGSLTLTQQPCGVAGNHSGLWSH